MHKVDNLVVISAIVDLLGVSGLGHVSVPVEVHGPGAGLPLSHLVVVLNRGWGSLGLSHPVHDLVVISRIIDGTLRPALAPVSGVVLHKVILGDTREADALGNGEERHGSGEFHFYNY